MSAKRGAALLVLALASVQAAGSGTLLGNARDIAEGGGTRLIMLPDGTVASMAEVRLATREHGAGRNDTLLYDAATGMARVRNDAAVSTLLLEEPGQRILVQEPNFQRLSDGTQAARNRIGRFDTRLRGFYEAYPGTQYRSGVLDAPGALVWVGSFAPRYEASLPPGSPFQPDSDGDSVPDEVDNCIFIANGTQQLDTNADGFGNRCDADLNNDCIVNAIDLGLLRTEFFSTGALDQDFNGDGVVNAIDLGILRTLFFSPPGPSALAACSSSGLP